MMSFSPMSAGEKLESDVVVIGGGGCGLAAAITVRECGGSVILLEKRVPGGNTALAHGLFGVESTVQKRQGIDASVDDCFRIAMEHSHWKINPRLFRAFLNKSADTIRWLEEKGLDFDPIMEERLGGGPSVWHVWKRKGNSSQIIRVLRQSCEEFGVQLLTHCPAQKILADSNGSITGVIAGDKGQKIEISAKSVIIATGGYGASKELMKKYYPYYNDKMIYAGVPNKGDGLLMAIELGAATEGLGNLLLHPHFYKGSRYIQSFSGGGMRVLLNKNGERFTDENRGAMTFAIAKQPDTLVYVLFDEKMKTQFIKEHSGKVLTTAGIMAGAMLPDMDNEFRIESDLGGVKIAESWDEIAEWMQVKPEVLNATMEEYNHFCDIGKDELFSKDPQFLIPLRTPPYYALRTYIHYLTTLGGIKVNHHLEVLNIKDKPILGLYGGGDAVGGWETDVYCPLRGHALGFAINSGRIAGENAAKYLRG